MSDLDNRQRALLELLHWLSLHGYRFVTTTPETHARVLKRREGELARDVRDVFGWSRPFDLDAFEPELVALLRRADALEPAGEGRARSAVRVSSLGGRLFLHSAYPTEAEDSVFFGPDSYRFADLIVREIADLSPNRIVDVGTGSGVGAVVAAGMKPHAAVVMTDINPAALRLARVNAAHAGVGAATTAEGEGLAPVDGGFDLVLLNPPYIEDDGGRLYRHGGGLHGARLSVELATEACRRLSPGGRLVLYTGSAIIGGRDRLRDALAELGGCTLSYRELDPDVFGEELERPAYREVERIALVAAVLTRGDR